MAFADWTALSGFNVTPQTGAAFLNSSLTNPLTIGSTYCRRFTGQHTGSVVGTSGISVASSYAGGALVNVPDSKAIRLQGYLRLESAQIANNNSGGWLGAKMPSNFVNSGAINNLYALGIKTTATGTPEFSLMLNGGVTTSLGAAAFAQWYGLRLDVFPLGAVADRLIAYRETSPGSGTWTTLSDTTVPSTGAYVSWGGNRKNGLFFLQAQTYTAACIGYADLVTVAVGNAPAPIP